MYLAAEMKSHNKPLQANITNKAYLAAEVRENKPQNQQLPKGTAIKAKLSNPNPYLLWKAFHMICAG